MHLFFSLHVHVILILTHLFYIKMAYFYLQINEKNGHEQKQYIALVTNILTLMDKAYLTWNLSLTIFYPQKTLFLDFSNKGKISQSCSRLRVCSWNICD